jgi:pilus assembly protein CpaC
VGNATLEIALPRLVWGADMVVARYSSARRRLDTASKAAGARFVAQQGLFAFAAVLALALVVLLLPAHTRALANGLVFALDDPSRIARLAVTINKSETIRFKQSFAKALVASPEYADIAPLTDRSLYIIGKKVGQTRVTVLDKDERLLSVIDVEIGFDVPGLRKALRESLPNSHVHVTSANGRILLSGLVPDAPTQARALAIGEQFAPLAVTNSLMVRASQQVLLAVRFVEVSRSAMRDLGINWDVLSRRFIGATGAASLFPLAGIPSGATPFGEAIVGLFGNGIQANLIIEALERRGLARRLAEPNLVTLSGDTANFLAGGEFPYPVAQTGTLGSATITVEFKKFGIGLAFTPTVLGEGQINLKIEPEVSDIDPTRTFTYGGGITVPGLIVRRANVTIELRDGQSFAIAGLLDNKHSTDQAQLPWVGQIPVLGTLFRSASFQKSETDLVIIVTPHLVKPAVPGEKLETPLEQRVPGNDIDFFLMGRAERDPRERDRAEYGHILEVQGPWAATIVPEGIK